MKLFLTYLIFLSTVSAEWVTSLEKAIEISQKSQKPIFVDLYTDWCAYCKDLEQKIFPKDEVAIELEKFTKVRINGDLNQELVRKFNIKGYPSILILDKSGYFLDKLTGLPTPKGLVDRIKSAYEIKDIEQVLIDKQLKNTTDVEANFLLGNFYYKNANYKQSIEFFRKAANSPKEEPVEKKSESLLLLGISLIQEKKYSESNSIWNLFLEKYPNEKLDIIYYCNGISYYYDGKKEKAKEMLLKAKEYSNKSEQLQIIEELLNEL